MPVTRECTIFHQTTIRVLGELGADAKKMITVLNKVDLIPDESTLHALRLHFPDGTFVLSPLPEKV